MRSAANAVIVTPSFAALVQTFFAEHLDQQRALSPRTVATYRDAFMLFLVFAQTRLGKSPAAINLTDITPELILAFLDHLEQQRHNSVRSRNLRLGGAPSVLEVRGTPGRYRHCTPSSGRWVCR